MNKQTSKHTHIDKKSLKNIYTSTHQNIYRPIWFQEQYRFSCHTRGGSQEHDRRRVRQLHVCTALVQEHVYTWVISSSFVMLLEAPQIRVWLPIVYTSSLWSECDIHVHPYSNPYISLCQKIVSALLLLLFISFICIITIISNDFIIIFACHFISFILCNKQEKICVLQSRFFSYEQPKASLLLQWHASFIIVPNQCFLYCIAFCFRLFLLLWTAQGNSVAKVAC